MGETTARAGLTSDPRLEVTRKVSAVATADESTPDGVAASGEGRTAAPEEATSPDVPATKSAADAPEPSADPAPAEDAADDTGKPSAPEPAKDEDEDGDETADASAKPATPADEPAASSKPEAPADKADASETPAEPDPSSDKPAGFGKAPAPWGKAAASESSAPAKPEAPATADVPAKTEAPAAKPATPEGKPAAPAPAASAKAEAPAPKAETPAAKTETPAKTGSSSDKSAGFGAAPAPWGKATAEAAAASEKSSGTATAPEERERTRQQPLPPDPLKLLAELTNTPPPPETLLRTVVRRVKIWTPLVALLVIVFCVVQAVRPLPTPELKLTATPSYTIQGGPFTPPWPSEGQAAVAVAGLGVVGTYGAQKPAPTASMAKTMTAYLVLRDHPLKGDQPGPKITVDDQADKEAHNADESRVPVHKGQQFTEHQMLEMLMIPSGNNVARLLGRWDSGTDAAFVKKMNDTAKQLGMADTTYTDPSGLDAGTRSTALDQIKLAQAVMGDAVFRDVVAMPQADIPGLPGRIYNNNSLLTKITGMLGIKTGSSTPAGGNLLWAARRTIDGKPQLILGAVMGQQSGYSPDASLQKAIAASEKVITQVQSGLTSAQVIKKGQVVGYVDDGLGGRTAVVAGGDLSAVGWPGMRAKLSLTANGKGVPHQAKAGTAIGTLSFGAGPAATQVPAVLQSALNAPGFFDKLGNF
nr:D-alanyl-D-alanine carboxypeptidase [Streptomyces sp. SID5468]